MRGGADKSGWNSIWDEHNFNDNGCYGEIKVSHLKKNIFQETFY